jgi:hypothetical protein
VHSVPTDAVNKTYKVHLPLPRLLDHLPIVNLQHLLQT